MRSKLHVLSFFTLLFSIPFFAQTLCDTNVDAGEDMTICAGNCVDLEATVSIGQLSEGYDTSGYVIYHDYCTPEPETATPTYITGDDDWSGVIDIGFDFSFFGNTYSQLLVGDNGVITFDISQANGYCPWSFSETIPNTGFPITNAIFGAYHDLYTPAAPNPEVVISYYTSGTAPFRTFVVDFNQVPQYSCNNLLTTQQIVLYETSNIILVNIIEKPVCTGWQDGVAVLGVMNQAGTIAYVPGPDTTPAGADPYPNRNTSAWEVTADNSESWQFVPIGMTNPDYTLTWYDDEGNVISNEPQVTVCPETDTVYKAELVIGDYMPMTDTVEISVIEGFNAGQAEDMYECANGDSTDPVTFDLSTQDAAIIAGQDGLAVDYYLTEDDAVSGENAIDGDTFVMNEAGTQTIYARLFSTDTGAVCYDITQFNLIYDIVSAEDVMADGCTTEPGSSEMEVNLAQYEDDIAGDQEGVTVTFYATQADAEAGTNSIGDTYTGETTTLYSRVENESGCYDVAEVGLIINALPEIFPVDDVQVCNEGYSTGIYNLDVIAETALGDQADVDISFYETEADAVAGENEIMQGEEVSLTAPRTLFVRAMNNQTGCATYDTVNLKIENCPPIVPNTFTPNGDGTNDEFTIHRLKTVFENYHLQIFNRWGTLVYEGGPDDPFWDGTVDGVMGDDPSGTVYFYVLDLNDGENEPLKGTIYVKP